MIERLVSGFFRALTRGVLQGVAAEVRAQFAQAPAPVVYAPPSPLGGTRVTIPDIAPEAQDIDVLGALKQAAREAEVDLSDVSMVEAVLREQQLARLEPKPDNGTQRVRAPDA